MRSVLFAFGLVAVGISSSSASDIASRSNDTTAPAYLNPHLCIDERVDDILSRMSIEEKAGQMYHARTSLVNNTFDANIKSLVANKHITHYVFSGGVNDARAVATWQNELQQFAKDSGLGIPITLSSDPQHGWTADTAVSNVAGSFSRWTEPMGIAALRSPELARRFAEIAREEYIAVGLRQALHPQVDLATEPRWGRSSGTMGEDANLTTSLLVEYIKGFQGDKIGPHSVITTTKHFPGGGPMENGEDSHFPWVRILHSIIIIILLLFCSTVLTISLVGEEPDISW
jgi:beta-glucosidase-like glycosyl hydrolase